MLGKIKHITVGIIIGILVSGTGFADNDCAKACFTRHVKVVIDGVKQDVEVAIINGKSYLPIRELGKIMGIQVAWNSKKRHIEISRNLIRAEVKRVVDGDTFVALVNGEEIKVRLIGVDTPESVEPNHPVEPYGKQAGEFTRKHLEGKTVFLEYDVEKRDKYGRHLCYVYIDGKMFNRMLLEEGYATNVTIPPNVRYADEFKKLVEKARIQRKGLWKLQQK